MLPATTERVAVNTPDCINEKIRRRTDEHIAYYAQASRAAIDARLLELDEEWDIERTLETNAAAVSLVGLTLGATVSRKWFLFPGVVAAFLMQHAVQGWCPPVPLFRRLGIRTAAEIAEERYALKALRGDFRQVSQESADGPCALEAIEAVRM
ncbi:DUF2892 domain-containing protein [Lignipirellula cremea]|uniref:DUF2892 domain-containing protein n=1 Tax=Lignipirellula cremea TaxID=2528010 RepID=A0A518DP11_9BACT|nr:DUF2892 domain-containing protein [Lignipirellula cremea]QDU93580.1 hypothetical protein Pla8534_13600 [Lignipirellula cremea]